MNKFSKTVSFGHSHEFIQGEKEDQEIAEACRRLVKNGHRGWNYLYLSRVLAEKKNEERRPSAGRRDFSIFCLNAPNYFEQLANFELIFIWFNR